MRIKIILLLIILAIGGAGIAFVSTSYVTTPIVVDSAGGKATSASYSTSFAVGEVGMKTSSSANYINKSHFAYTFFTTPAVPANTPEISLDKSEMSFTAVQGGANPTNLPFAITNSGGGVLVPSVADDMAWLSLSAPTPISVSGTSVSNVTVSVNIIGLTAGAYTGTITVSDSVASNNPQTIGVTLTVSEPVTVLPEITITPTTLDFTAIQGGSNPASKTLTISNSGGGTLKWSATDDKGWISVNPTSEWISSTQTSTVNVEIIGNFTTAGIYTGTITISDSVASNAPQTIGVTLTVSEPVTVLPKITITPTTLDFTAIQGGSNPASKTFTISNSGSGTLKWAASDNRTWLSVTPTDEWVSGTQTSTVSANVNITGLTAGLHIGTIVVEDSAASNSPKTVTVNLTIASNTTGGGDTTSPNDRSNGNSAGCFIKKLVK
ncbi:MAG: hypothetical protein HZA48_11470 [Planctomycetes bacterium]|nr:hypothetical protein [Planctomycetota bacterium]